MIIISVFFFPSSDAHQCCPVTRVSPVTSQFLVPTPLYSSLLCWIIKWIKLLWVFFQQLLLTSPTRAWRRSRTAACWGWESDRYEYSEGLLHGGTHGRVVFLCCRCPWLWVWLRSLAPSCSSWCWWSINVGSNPSSASIVSLGRLLHALIHVVRPLMKMKSYWGLFLIHQHLVLFIRLWLHNNLEHLLHQL